MGVPEKDENKNDPIGFNTDVLLCNYVSLLGLAEAELIQRVRHVL